MIWPVVWPAHINADALDPAVRERAELMAGETLRMLTLYRVGGEPITVMPCARTCRSPLMRVDLFAPVPYSAWALRNCSCTTGCTCSGIAGVTLGAPVGDIIEVRVDGAVIDPAVYRVVDGDRLIRTDGEVWPACAGDSFTVTYLNAHPVDDLGQFAGGVLAGEYLKLITADKTKCRLPSSVTNVNRQGLTFEITRGMFPDGMTSIPEVDMYLMRWNPNGLKVRPAVYSPDLDEPQPVTWRAGL